MAYGGQLVVHQNPCGLSCKAAFQLFGAHPVLAPEVVLPQVQGFTILFVELHEIAVCLLKVFIKNHSG